MLGSALDSRDLYKRKGQLLTAEVGAEAVKALIGWGPCAHRRAHRLRCQPVLGTGLRLSPGGQRY